MRGGVIRVPSVVLIFFVTGCGAFWQSTAILAQSNAAGAGGTQPGGHNYPNTGSTGQKPPQPFIDFLNTLDEKPPKNPIYVDPKEVRGINPNLCSHPGSGIPTNADIAAIFGMLGIPPGANPSADRSEIVKVQEYVVDKEYRRLLEPPLPPSRQRADDEFATKHLIGFLSHSSPEVRNAAVEGFSIGSWDAALAVPALKNFIEQSQDSEARTKAMLVLNTFGDLGSKALTEYRQSSNPEIAKSAQMAMFKILTGPPGKQYQIKSLAVGALTTFFEQSHEPFQRESALYLLMHYETGATRDKQTGIGADLLTEEAALKKLEELRFNSRVDDSYTIFEYLRSPFPKVRAMAEEAMRTQDTFREASRWLTSIDSWKTIGKRTGSGSLEKMPEREATKEVVKLMSHPIPKVRDKALRYLSAGSWDASIAVPALKKYIDQNPWPDYRARAMRILMKFGNEGRSEVKGYAQSPYVEIRTAARAALDTQDAKIFKEATPAEIQSFFAAKGKTVVTFVGYSGAGYQDQDAMLKIARDKLNDLDRQETIINIGGTPDGIGAVYELAKEMGFQTSGIVSTQGREYMKERPSNVDYLFFVNDPTWGGYVNGSSTLSPTSEAMVSVSKVMIGLGGGDVGRDELIEAHKRGLPVDFHPADMNHETALKKAAKAGKPAPTDFSGSANSGFQSYLSSQSKTATKRIARNENPH